MPSSKRSSLPESLVAMIFVALRAAGDPSPTFEVERKQGGFTAHSLHLVTRQGRYFLKWAERPLEGMFSVEARGLEMLARTGVVRVPAVLASQDATAERPGFLLQEWIAPGPALWPREFNAHLGRAIAELHHASQKSEVPGYGLGHDSQYWGSWQPAGWYDDWVSFFRERRLLPLVERERARGLIGPDLAARLERLMERLDEWLGGVVRAPVLLHGDLWRNNVLCSRKGQPVLVDPCVYYGDREAELAYAALYSNFSPTFFQSYEERWPLPPGREERQPFYHLWYHLHLMKHTGTAPLPRIEASVRWYVG